MLGMLLLFGLLLPGLIWTGSFALGVIFWIKILKKREISIPRAWLAGFLSFLIAALFYAGGFFIKGQIDPVNHFPVWPATVLGYLIVNYFITRWILRLCLKGTLPPWLLGNFTAFLGFWAYGAALRLMK